MKQFLITVTGVFVGILLFLVVTIGSLFFALLGSAKPTAAPADSVLALDLRGSITDQPAVNPLFAITGGSQSVMTIVEALERAKGDERIKGLFVRLPDGGMDPAAAEEIRQAVIRFRGAGKVVFAHSQGLYASGPVTATYMLGAAADRLWMQAGAPFEAVGLSTEDIFFARAFERYGVDAQFERREEAKTAVNGYLFADYTPAHKDSQLSWMRSVYERTLANAAADRKLAPAVLRASIEAGPYDAAQAATAGLIDQLGQPEEAQEALMKRVAAREVVEFDDYAAVPDLAGSGPTIAVIRAEGAIVTGAGGQVSPFGGAEARSDEIAEGFREAAKDEDVKAIVFRVSSPGGIDTAADQIAAAVRAAKAAGKPVVVSMGSYAASGGYWVSADASAIVAQPTTLTGSIGVYGGKFAVGDAAARFGVDLRQTSVGGEFAGVGSLGAPFTPAQRAAYAAQIDRTYQRFIAGVAAGRKLPAERVRELAGGRVWTGEQAKAVGLVDELGGFQEGVARAKALAKIEGAVQLEMLPRQLQFFEALEQALGLSASGARTLAAAGWVLGDPRAEALLEQAARARLQEGRATVLAPTPLR